LLKQWKTARDGGNQSNAGAAFIDLRKLQGCMPFQNA